MTTIDRTEDGEAKVEEILGHYHYKRAGGAACPIALEMMELITTKAEQLATDRETKGYLAGLNFACGVAKDLNTPIGIGACIYSEYQRVATLNKEVPK